MFQIIGNKNCPKCMMVKKLLENKKIEFEYKLLDDIENKSEILNNAREKGILTAPIILKNSEFLSFDDLMNYIKTLQ